MPKENDIRWKRLVAEGTAIVFSILLAFWIDAWWDQREDAEEERILLETLLTDLRTFRESRAGRDQYLDAIIESGRSLLDIGRSPTDQVTDGEIDHLLNDLTYIAGAVDQGSPALDLLFDGGMLALITSSEIRKALANLRFAVTIEKVYGDREIKFVDEIYYPYLDSNGSLAQLWGADDGQPGAENSAFSPTNFPIGREGITEAEISHQALLESRQFQNILIRRIMHSLNAKGWEESMYDVDAQLEELISLIEQELNI